MRGLRAFLCVSVLAAMSARGASAQLPDSVAVQGVAALNEFEHVCKDPVAALWRLSLCGAIVLVDPDTRAFLANRQPSAGTFAKRGNFYTGILSGDVVIANTATGWGTQRWTMVMLPLPDDPFDRTRLLIHEAFHRIQPELDLPAFNVMIPQLEERDARYWVRLELRALSAAQLDSGDERARQAAANALLFRAVRHREYPGIDTLEAALELNEGLAEYSGMVVAGRIHHVSNHALAQTAMTSLERRATFVRSYAYGTGPLLGLALDRFAPAWRNTIASTRSLSAALAGAIDWTEPASLAEQARARASAYDGAVIAEEEDRRAQARALQLAGYRARLIDGPVLILHQRGLGGGFNPNTIIPLGDAGLVYPSRTVFAEWGELTVDSGGLLVANDRTLAYVTAEGLQLNAGTATGNGWALKLAPGWTIRRGARSGDFELVQGSTPAR